MSLPNLAIRLFKMKEVKKIGIVKKILIIIIMSSSSSNYSPIFSWEFGASLCEMSLYNVLLFIFTLGDLLTHI